MAIEKEVIENNGQECKYYKIDKIEADYFNLFNKKYSVILKKYKDASYRQQEKDLENKVNRYIELTKKKSLTVLERKELESFNPRALYEQYYTADYSLGTETKELTEKDIRELVYSHLKTLPQFAKSKDILEENPKDE